MHDEVDDHQVVALVVLAHNVFERTKEAVVARPEAISKEGFHEYCRHQEEAEYGRLLTDRVGTQTHMWIAGDDTGILLKGVEERHALHRHHIEQQMRPISQSKYRSNRNGREVRRLNPTNQGAECHQHDQAVCDGAVAIFTVDGSGDGVEGFAD